MQLYIRPLQIFCIYQELRLNHILPYLDDLPQQISNYVLLYHKSYYSSSLKGYDLYRLTFILLIDRASEGDKMRIFTMELGYKAVVPSKSNRKNPWDYDKQ